MKPAITFISVGHDDDCPGRYTDGEGCTCNPTFTIHHDEQRFIRNEQINRAARRQAEREAARALRKARRAKP